MAWKSRQDKAPPPQFWADVIGYLYHAFPGAELTREALTGLAPYLTREWQNGQSGRNAAKATCACDGRVITVSPAAEVHLARRAALPPANIPRGNLFGIDALRERREIGTLRVKAAVEQRHAEYQTSRLAQLKSEHDRLLGAGKSAKAANIAQLMAATEAAIKGHRAQSAQLVQQAEQLARERGFWIPPSAPEAAKQVVSGKRGGTPKAKPAQTAAEPKKRASKVTPGVPAKPAAPKKKCDLCTEQAPPEPDLSALVDEFVDAAMKDGGK